MVGCKGGVCVARSGSENRKRSTVITARFDEEEARQIRRLAERSGLSVAALMRKTLLNAPAPKAVRRPSVDPAAAAQILAQLGKIGSNVNQLAHYAHLGRFQASSIEVALRDLAELRAACLLALGQEADGGGDDGVTMSAAFNRVAKRAPR